jgi:type I restriction enzyme M protein
MHWIAPSERDTATDTLEKRLWAAADQLRANSGLTSKQYGQPVLGLIFLRFAEVRFAAPGSRLEKGSAKGGTGHTPRRGSRLDEHTAFHAEGILYLLVEVRLNYLLNRPDPACRSGGMFVSSARFVSEHKKNPADTFRRDLYPDFRADFSRN